MGGKYRITGDKYPRMRRPRRRGKLILAATASVVALGLAGWGTLQLIDVFTGGDRQASAADHKTDCSSAKPSTPAKALPKPAKITVNVYNATPRSGLAKKAADELKKRGFTIGKVGNAPAAYDKKVAGPGCCSALRRPRTARSRSSVRSCRGPSSRPMPAERRTSI